MSIQTKKDGRIFCVYYDKGKQIWEPFGREKTAKKAAQARDLEIKMKKKQGTWYKKSHGSPLTFHELAQQYLHIRANQLSTKTMDEIIRVLTNYALPVIGTNYLPTITMDHWWQIQEKMTARHIKNRSINTYFVYLSKIFTWAMDENEDLLEIHPWQKRKRLRIRTKFRIDLFTHDEFLSILDAAQPHLKWAMQVAYYTGVRPGPTELFALQWTDMDWFNNRIKIYSPKTDHHRWLNLPGEFMEKLKTHYRGDQPQSKYIVSYKGNRLESIKTAWNAAKQKAGITRNIRLYDIRHYYISYALANGADIMELAQSVGHVNGEMIMRVYAHLAKDLQTNQPHKIPSLYK